MKTLLVQVWFLNDIDDAEFTFTHQYTGDDLVAHQIISKSTQLHYPTAIKILVENI